MKPFLNINKKATLTTISIIALLAATISAVNLPTTTALEIPTYLLVAVEPDPVGVGQQVYVSVFMTKPTATAAFGGAGDVYTGIKVEITEPDGSKQTLGPFTADTTGGVGGITFTPDTVGNYSIKATYPGQTLTYGTTYNGTVMKASESAPVTLMVQQDAIVGIALTPLPTEYWTRPIYSTNYVWSELGGSWFGLGAPSFATTGGYDASGNFNPYSPAPDTAHVMWVKPTQFGGQVGAPYLGDQESQYTSSSIAIRHWEPIILNGILFYTEYSSVDSVPKSWKAVDIRTGELLWERTPGTTGDELLRYGQIIKFHTIQEYGSFPILWSVPRTGSVVFRIYDPVNGAYLGNVTDAQNLAMLMDVDTHYSGVGHPGALLGWYTSGGNLTLWNSTKALFTESSFGDVTSKTIVTARISATRNFTSGVEWSVKVPTTLDGKTIAPALSIAARTHEVILMRSAPNLITQTSAGYAVEAGFDATTGRLLWGPVNRTVPLYGDMSLMAAADGYYVTHNKDTNEAYGFSLETGQALWGPVKLEGNAFSALERGGAIAYGKCYIWDFGGYVNAIDLETGKVAWTFTRGSAGYDTPYGIYPIWHFGTHSIADGMIFLSEGHMYDPPMFPNSQRLAINCTDGSLVWSILSFSGRAPGAIADGYLLQWNSYDAQIYSFGKGPTDTTITTAPKVSLPGSSVIIEGTVMDTAAGTKDADRSARFPDGVPVVSDASMSDWMEYIYMQQPKPTNSTGVTVTLSVLDANGNYRTIGTTTTDLDGCFSFDWTPDIEGKYTVVASFEGTNSYWPSHAQTAFKVDQAPEPTATTQPVQSQPPFEMYFAASTIAILIGIAVAAVIIIRKKL